MQLNDILEESNVKKISQKTNISKENIEILMDDDFASLTKAKALGFISILERDYRVDLKMLRDKALAYYAKHGNDEERMVFTLPMSGEKADTEKGTSLFTVFVVLGLLAYASWYFMSKYDEKTLRTFLPFNEENIDNKSGITDTIDVKENQ
ncbi:MAG TPA: hypothetical protein EYG82_06125 [Sulfurovum sp.]|nr:hypothetical protein [Sulfurovum sp.]